jgi:hypothetical protein
LAPGRATQRSGTRRVAVLRLRRIQQMLVREKVKVIERSAQVGR